MQASKRALSGEVLKRSYEADYLNYIKEKCDTIWQNWAPFDSAKVRDVFGTYIAGGNIATIGRELCWGGFVLVEQVTRVT